MPLLVEDNYRADGWLGALVGMLKYYRFVADSEVDAGMPPLEQELGDRGKVGSQHAAGPGKLLLQRHQRSYDSTI